MSKNLVNPSRGRIGRMSAASRRAFSGLRASLRDYGKGERYRGEQCDILLYCTDNNRALHFHGRWFAQIIDAYAELCRQQAGETALTTVPLGSTITGEAAYGRTFGPPLGSAFAQVAAMHVDGATGRRLQLTESVEQRRFERLLQRCGCRRVVGIQPQQPLIAACESRGVPIYDLQHGDISGGIPYYETYAKPDSNLRYLVWDEESKTTLTETFGVEPEKVEVFGNPLLRLYREGEGAFEAHYEEERAQAASLLSGSETATVALVSMQWGVAQLYPDDFENPFFSKALTAAMQESEDIVWWLRVHPNMMGSREVRSALERFVAENDRAILCEPDRVSLPTSLDLADCHITWHSSTVVESVALSIPSLVLCNSQYNYNNLGEDEHSRSRLRLPYEQYRHSGLVEWNSGETVAESRQQIIQFVLNSKKCRELG